MLRVPAGGSAASQVPGSSSVRTGNSDSAVIREESGSGGGLKKPRSGPRSGNPLNEQDELDNEINELVGAFKILSIPGNIICWQTSENMPTPILLKGEYHCMADLHFVYFGFTYNIFTCLVEYNPVQQEVIDVFFTLQSK